MTTAREETALLSDLLRREHHALGDFLAALAAFDRERRWVELGYNSLFSFLTRELGLSKGAAFFRNRAAELIQKFPQVLEPIRDGRICLTTVAELSRVVTAENFDEVLPRFGVDPVLWSPSRCGRRIPSCPSPSPRTPLTSARG